jgi:hypothetical protein
MKQMASALSNLGVAAAVASIIIPTVSHPEVLFGGSPWLIIFAGWWLWLFFQVIAYFALGQLRE